MLRVGIIGCGRISDLHVLGYRGRADAEIVALCDLSIPHIEAKAAEWGLGAVDCFDDHRALCTSGRVDLVEIIVPHHLHSEVAGFAIECDLHVSLQKPLALNLDDADRLVELAARSERTARLYENFLFYPPVLKAAELIGQGLIGEPLAVRLKSNSGYSPEAWAIPWPAMQWRLDPATCGGGPLTFDDGHHKFALAWLMLGQPTEIHAWIGATDVMGAVLDSPSIISMRYDGGAVGSLEAVYSPELLIRGTSHYAQDDRIEVTGTRGVIWVNRGHGQIGEEAPVVSYADGHTVTHDCESGWEHSFMGATRSLLDDLAAGAPPTLTFAEGRDVLAAALAAQRSATAGAAVAVEAPIGRVHSAVRSSLPSPDPGPSSDPSRPRQGGSP
ncbi:MAG: Gfo/Idh/MocA family oxidoreductase [bacterium]|nr:Gfo/Idh/MocA family oxidoreductase [bacterium]